MAELQNIDLNNGSYSVETLAAEIGGRLVDESHIGFEPFENGQNLDKHIRVFMNALSLLKELITAEIYKKEIYKREISEPKITETIQLLRKQVESIIQANPLMATFAQAIQPLEIPKLERLMRQRSVDIMMALIDANRKNDIIGHRMIPSKMWESIGINATGNAYLSDKRQDLMNAA